MYIFEQSLLLAIPAFSLLILLEFLYGLWRRNDTYSNRSDAISSLLSGLTFVVSNTIGFGLLVIGYDWVHGYFATGELNASIWWIWPLTFVVMDVASYWTHRWAHENGFLWSMHLIHHSSEEFNLPVALRQNAFKWFSYRPLLLLPLAMVGVPVEVVAVIAPVHYFLQYWYHTQHIGKLGWLEYIIVTPSQHRVHHAINDVYIDKNYSSIFCWDRLFGSFQEELDDEPCVYGSLGPVQSWDPMRIELRYITNMLRDAMFTREWGDKVRVFTGRAGWRPSDVADRWPGRYVDDYKNLARYRPVIPVWLQWWGFAELLAISTAALYLFANIASIAASTSMLVCFVGMVLLSINSLAALLEGDAGWLGAIARVLVAAYVIVSNGSLFGLSPPLTLIVLMAMLLMLIIRFQRYMAARSLLVEPAVGAS